MTPEPEALPQVRVRSAWKVWLGRLVVPLLLFALGAVAARTRKQWLPYAMVPVLRLKAELKPIWQGAEDRFATPALDAGADHSAARLSTPRGPARVRRQQAPVTGERRAPMLSGRGIAVADEMRASMDGPLLIDAPVEDTYWKKQSWVLIALTLGIAGFFGCLAWYRSDRSRTMV